MPRLPPSFSKAFHTANTLSFFHSGSQVMAEKLNAFQEDDQFLKYGTVVTWRAWVSHVNCEKVLKLFLPNHTSCLLKSQSLQLARRSSSRWWKQCGAMTSCSRGLGNYKYTNRHTRTHTWNTAINIKKYDSTSCLRIAQVLNGCLYIRYRNNSQKQEAEAQQA